MGRFGVGVFRSLGQSVADLVASLQLSLGREPTLIHTPRMALEQWKYALREISPPDKGPIMVIAFRNRRWVEWAVFSACYISRMGYQPYLLYSGQEIADLYRPQGIGECLRPGFWAGVQDIPFLQLIDIDRFMGVGATDRYEEFIQRAAHTIAAYNLRIEEYEPGEDPAEYRREVDQAVEMLRANATAFEKVLRTWQVQRIICPSGLIAKSFAFRRVAQEVGVPAVFVEGWSMRPGHMIWNVGRPALEYDIEGWLRAVGEWDEDREAETRDYMAFREGAELQDSKWLENFHQVQRSTKDSSLPPALERFLERPGRFFLMGTNVIGDSATLGRATIFRSQHDWIAQVVAFFRMHPDELVKRARQRLGEVALAAARGAANIYVVLGSQDVNTYALVDRVDVGLAWVSNIGLDMAIRGKPVILAAAAQYAPLGACHVPTSSEGYFDLVQQLAVKPTGPADAQDVNLGKAYHYIVFKLMSLEADSRRYLSIDYRLGEGDSHPDRRTFYRILVGELSKYGEPLPEEVEVA